MKKEGDSGKIDPNPATFLIRAVVAWINLATYFSGSETTIIRNSVLIVSSVSLSLIFCITMFLKKWKMVKIVEILCLVLATLVLVVWKQTNDPVTANLLMQVVLVISLAPQALRMYQLKERHKSLPWIFATAAYVFMTLALLVDTQGFKPFQLVNPLVPGIGGNGLFAILAYRQEKIFRNQTGKQ